MNEEVKIENGNGKNILKEFGEEVKEEKATQPKKKWQGLSESLHARMKQNIHQLRMDSQFAGCTDVTEPFLAPTEKLLDLAIKLNLVEETPSHLIASMLTAIVTIALKNPAALKPLTPAIASLVPVMLSVPEGQEDALMRSIAADLKTEVLNGLG